MTKWLGCALLVSSSALLGLRVQQRGRENIKVLREMLAFLEELRSEIRFRHTPMPQLMQRLCERKCLFNTPPVFREEEDFGQQWKSVVSAMALDEDCREALCGMGLSLSGGEDPDKSVELAAAVLVRCAERQERETERRGRVPMTVGLCSGALLAVLLL